jgi:uncharacterized membrane protein YphA (DoxX/SURF4 family)
MLEKKELSKSILRIGMSLVFLYFGFRQASSPDDWIGYVPSFLTGTIITANNLVILNSIIEITLGLFLLIGIYVKASALILAVHLFFITFSLGLSPLGVRDFGLAIATLVVYLNGKDRFCFETRMK